MKISDVAVAAGCSVRSVRHLHQSGAVAEPARTSSNYREYTISDLAAVVRARALIDAGVPIADVAAKDTALVVEHALDQLDSRIAHLQQQRKRLARLASNPSGAPEDIRQALGGVFTDPQALQRELDAWDLMALTGVTTAATWDQLRTNLNDPECVKAARAAEKLWDDLGEMRPRDSNVAETAARFRELLPHGLLRGVLSTLQPGDVPLGVHDVPTRGAQRVVLQALAEGFDG
ncbi:MULTISPECIES: MerR family transcriptional regulator [Corynebacterium]|uniref:MerR family transcriptional regulator n=1 Tax=Corynebacterium lipophilum TaxID=2804918 RepID=A0AAW5HVY6_9CORY|nr:MULTISPECIES: MerR family transcriptional regulator [Corynebacterium]MCO6393687.1 MerR family transcriptional regulator [Corynebacterium lipophilum]MCZ2117098.1 MerR family transcriptional regulator [Corynebacterium lipophilum]OIR45203.1 hypothetical protein BJP06_01835 [Corynebacterium sp. NML120713]UUA86336.1 MerR family transcriptional regulator [Corynebacterium pseudogenitalium]WPJ92968.1 MerR family transcriptional regulator [Corynebacterium sp. UMB2355A]